METQAKLVIQACIKQEKYELCTSAALYYEVDASPYISQSAIIRKFIQDYTFLYIGEEMMDEVEKLSHDIMSTGVKYYDACHVASAILAECDYFITVDKRLLKYKSEKMRIINPVDFVSEMEVD